MRLPTFCRHFLSRVQVIIKVDVQSDKSEWTDGPGVIFEYPTTRVSVPPVVSGAIVVGVRSDNGQEQVVHIQVLSGKENS